MTNEHIENLKERGLTLEDIEKGIQKVCRYQRRKVPNSESVDSYDFQDFLNHYEKTLRKGGMIKNGK